jgi:hypothetical protein
MLEAQTIVAARDVVERAGDAALESALAFVVDSSDLQPVPTTWRDALRKLAEVRLSDERLAVNQLVFCAAILAPAKGTQLSPERPDLRELANTPLEGLPTSLRIPAAFLLVTLGLRAESDVGGRLLARGFFYAHHALERSAEPPEAWRMLQPQLPVLWFWEEWDRCLKLRRALEYWLRAHPAAVDTIRSGARGPEERRWIESLREEFALRNS